jgi:hypothetical protein
MAKGPSRRIVAPHHSQGWMVKADRTQLASTVTRNRADAVDRARKILKSSWEQRPHHQDRQNPISDCGDPNANPLLLMMPNLATPRLGRVIASP